MGNLEYEPQSSENIALTAKLVGEALGELELFKTEIDEEAMERLAGMLPIQAPEGMCFRVQPLKPNYALSIQATMIDRSVKDILISARSDVRDIEVLNPQVIYRDEDNVPIFAGSCLKFYETIGRFVVLSRGADLSVLCNPFLNSTELAESRKA